MPDTIRKSAKRYTLSEKMTIAKVVDASQGNIKKARQALLAKGYSVCNSTIIQCFAKYGDKEILLRLEQSSGPSSGKNPPEQRKAAVRIYEVCKFIWKDTAPVLKRDLGLTISSGTMRNWYNEYGKEICDDNRFKDVLSNITNNIATQYESVAKTVAELSFEAKEKSLRRIIEIIPTENDINKLANIFKVIQEASINFPEDKPSKMIDQFNQYFTVKDKKE